MTGENHSYAALLEPLPLLKVRQIIYRIWLELQAAVTNSKEAQQQAANYRRELLELKKQKEALVKQRDQLGSMLHEIQSRQMSNLQSAKLAALDQLKAGMAHELNNALNVVRGVVKPLRQSLEDLQQHTTGTAADLLSQEVDQLLGHLSDSAERAKCATTSIIKMIPSEANEDTLGQDLHELFEIQLHWLKMSYPEINFDFQMEQDLRVMGDVSGLTFAVYHLMVNAIEATSLEAQPTVSLGMAESDGQLVIQVIDNGIGIPNDQKSKIFDPFYTTKDSEETAGLGLYSVRGLIAKMDGTVDVADNPNTDRGTTFVVSVPVEAPSTEVPITDLRVA